MKVLAQRGQRGSLLVIGPPLGKGRGMVVDSDKQEAFPEWNLNSILARGYWVEVTASKEEQAEAIKLARRRATTSNNSE